MVRDRVGDRCMVDAPGVFALVLVKGFLELCWPDRFVHGRGPGSD